MRQSLRVSSRLCLNSDYSLFQKKPKKLPDGIPSIKISSPLSDEVRGPKGELLEGRTTVVSQYVGTASRKAAWYD
jgi:hypothetical protein